MLKDEAIKLAKAGYSTRDISIITGAPERLVKQWTGAVRENKPPSVFSDGDPQQGKQPTSTRVGSIERVKVMRQRMERGESLYHEADSQELAPPR